MKNLLASHELQSSTWIKLREHVEAQIDLLRKQNDGDLSHDETVKLRGRIAALKSLLALGAQHPGLTQLVDDEE